MAAGVSPGVPLSAATRAPSVREGEVPSGVSVVGESSGGSCAVAPLAAGAGFAPLATTASGGAAGGVGASGAGSSAIGSPGESASSADDGSGGSRSVSVGGRERVRVAGVGVDVVSEEEVVRWVVSEAEAGRGGRIVTPNVDICRAAARDPGLNQLVRSAEIVVADGMPLVWAARLLGTPLPGRVTGADLIWSLSRAAARQGWPVFLLGGPPGVAVLAADELRSCHPRLKVAGAFGPPYHFDATPEGRERVRRRVVAARPRIVFVGLGFPRQDV
ncbi:MAG: WecB/TagA/CpsF family glycosyltransferase, partial [Nonomuraea sp.]|nr:WecB/TagA/CpsF family glycosyltransferase [Nonomuraea sp.]NUP69377.1 WecB/TagA/CpsF family glycosyltransferase [Nonomuraea sp.]